MPNYAPPSQQHPPAGGYGYGQPADGTPGGSGGGGQRALLAGVPGGLLVLGIVTGVALLLTSGNDEPEAEPQALLDDQTESDDQTDTSDPGVADPDADPDPAATDRIGTSVDGLGLLTGDCINFDPNAASVTQFDIVACETPHIAEISAQAEHPDAGGGFPGVDELHLWGGERCRTASSEFLGTDVLGTTLEATTLVPDFSEWGAGLTSISCLVRAADGARLIESVEGKGASYPRSTEVAVDRLRAGDCFVPGPGQTAYELGVNDITMLTSCNEPHDGLFFGRALLDFGPTAAFPGAETIEAEAIELCNTAFTRYFGVVHEGFNYRFWSPDEALWNLDDRTVHCAVIDENGLPIPLDFASFRPMFDLEIGSCFVFGPEETSADLRLDDQVEPVDCGAQHHGQIFGSGSLPDTDEPFPGSEALDTQIADECIELFTGFVGISPFDSESGDFIYWFPNETGWETDDLRWACALLTDELRVGSIEGARA